MTTGSLCLTEILKSRKPCSSKSDASQTADSTSASGVALPYLASRRGSSEPALTPIRIDVPASVAALAISLTWSSNLRMLPGLTRTAAQPASMALKTYFGWKWMSAITGICDLCAIAGSASASSCVGTATRTMSQPAAVSSAICCSVELMSVVCVVHIDWTLTGASPPTSTLPTLILRVLRRGARTRGGASGMPRLIGMLTSSSSHPAPGAPVREAGVCTRSPRSPHGSDLHRVDDVGVHEQQADGPEDHEHGVRERHQLGRVERTRPRQAAQSGHLPAPALPERGGDVPAVERRERDQVEDEQGDVQRGEHLQQRRGLDLPVDLVARGDLAGEPADADHADDAVGVARRVVDLGLHQVDHPRGQRGHDRHGLPRGARDDARDAEDRLRLELVAGCDAQEPDGL